MDLNPLTELPLPQPSPQENGSMSKTISKPHSKDLSNKIKLIRLEQYLEQKVKRVIIGYQHYAVLSLISVVLIHHFKKDDQPIESAITKSVFCINLVANVVYSYYLVELLQPKSVVFLQMIVKCAYPLSYLKEVQIANENSLYDLFFLIYLHRVYYIFQLIAYYYHLTLSKRKSILFYQKFGFKSVSSHLKQANQQNHKMKQGYQTWILLKKENLNLARNLSKLIVQQITEDSLLQTKHLLHFKPFVASIFLIFFTTIIFSYAFSQAESKYYFSNPPTEERLDSSDLLNSLYFISITIRTIGYGDICPKTFIGKVIACITSLWGIVFTSLALYIFNTYFTLSEKEKKECNIDSSEDVSKVNSEKECQQLVSNYQKMIVDLSSLASKLNSQFNPQRRQLMIQKVKDSFVYSRLTQLEQ